MPEVVKRLKTENCDRVNIYFTGNMFRRHKYKMGLKTQTETGETRLCFVYIKLMEGKRHGQRTRRICCSTKQADSSEDHTLHIEANLIFAFFLQLVELFYFTNSRGWKRGVESHQVLVGGSLEIA